MFLTLVLHVGGLFSDLYHFSAMSSVASSGNWHSHMTGSAMLEYDMPVHAPQSFSYSTASYAHSTHSR